MPNTPTAKRRGVHLHKRDLAVLDLLLDRRVETLDDVHTALFAAISRKSAANRLGKLARAGYITRLPAAHTRPDGSLCMVYRLGPKGPAALRLRSLASAEQLASGPVTPIAPALIPHQLAVNRVADWLGTPLTTPRPAPRDQVNGRHEPDGAYHAAKPDDQGRRTVLVEVDLGHYSRERILAKMRTFLTNPDARSIIFATPTAERATRIASWIRQAHGEHAMHRVQPLTFHEIQAGGLLDPGTEPAA